MRVRGWMVACGLLACTEIQVLERGDETAPGIEDVGGAGGDAGAPSGLGGQTPTPEPACELVLDWVEPLPLGENFNLGAVGFSRASDGVQLLTVKHSYDYGQHRLSTTHLEPFGPTLVSGAPTDRGVGTNQAQSLRAFPLPGGAFELADSQTLFLVPPGDGPGTTEELGSARMGWDLQGGRYLVTRAEVAPGDPGLVSVSTPAGANHELGSACLTGIDSSVGDGVVVTLWKASDCDALDWEPETWFVGPTGASLVDLADVRAYGRGAGGRTLGVGFNGHIVEIGPHGERGEVVATSPWDGNLVLPVAVEIAPWLDGFAVVILLDDPPLRGLRVRAYPAYGPPVDSPLLESNSVYAPHLFTTFADDASRTLLVAHEAELTAKLARFRCEERAR